MVYQAAQAVSLPIIGMGGIMNGEDAMEFILAGATAVSVGTANFANPFAAKETVEGIRAYMERYQVEDIRELIGAVNEPQTLGNRSSQGRKLVLKLEESRLEELEAMEQYKQEFIEFMIDCQALKFGEFTLKSGRKSPFFMNAGAYVTGAQLRKLGEYYAKAIHSTYGDDFDVLFGPAYKGIPISVATAMAYSGCTAGRSATAPTGRKRRITARIREASWEAA